MKLLYMETSMFVYNYDSTHMNWLMEFRKMTLHDSLELLFACRHTCLVPIYNTWKC